jgi:hypothetical protein
LKDQLDIYTGDPINYADPMTAAVNAVLPFFKNNGGHEPWRQWLLSTGWNNLQTLRTNRVSGLPLTAAERYWVNNWVARHAGLKEQIEALMEQDKAGKFTRKYRDARGNMTQKEYPIKESYIHDQLSKIHTDAFNAAWVSLGLENKNYQNQGLLNKYKKQQLQQGDTQGATKTQGQLDQLLKLN